MLRAVEGVAVSGLQDEATALLQRLVRGDLLLVAAADEEDGTNDVGARWLVRERPDLRVDYVLNEGAAERLDLVDGRRLVTIAVGEKAAAAVRVR